MNISTSGGRRYFVTFIDGYSQFIATFNMSHKFKVFTWFRELKALLENQVECKFKTLWSDRGGEYWSRELMQFLKDNGIKHQLTMPYMPQQNGVVESCNGTLMQMTCCILSHEKLSKAFWGESVITATYIHNRCPWRPWVTLPLSKHSMGWSLRLNIESVWMCCICFGSFWEAEEIRWQRHMMYFCRL